MRVRRCPKMGQTPRRLPFFCLSQIHDDTLYVYIIYMYIHYIYISIIYTYPLYGCANEWCLEAPWPKMLNFMPLRRVSGATNADGTRQKHNMLGNDARNPANVDSCCPMTWLWWLKSPTKMAYLKCFKFEFPPKSPNLDKFGVLIITLLIHISFQFWMVQDISDWSWSRLVGSSLGLAADCRCLQLQG